MTEPHPRAIYRTRAAIGRTIEQLSGNHLRRIFVAYGNLFLRVTHAVSCRQEFIADEVAARTAGALTMASALRKVRGAALAFRTYWNSEAGPLLNPATCHRSRAASRGSCRWRR